MDAQQEFNEQVIRSAPVGARLKVPGQPGLLFVNGKGRKSWTLRWAEQIGGAKQYRSLVLGTWPAMGLDAAKGVAALRRAEISMGRDPAQERDELRQAKDATLKKSKVPTMEQVWEKFVRERLEISRKDRGAVANRQVRKDCMGLLAQRISQVDVDAVTRTLAPVVERAPSMAASIKAHMGWAWEHAQETDFIPMGKNPFQVAFKRVKVLQQKTRSEKFRQTHWQQLFAWLPESGLTQQMQAILLLQACTGARAGEILGLHRDNIIFQTDGSAVWQGRFKTDDLRVLYFAKPAARLLRQIINTRKGSGWLFPKREHAGDGPMQTMALVTAINSVRHTCPINLAAEGQGKNWSSHTIRRSVRAGLTFERICDSDTAERVLGHAIGGVRSSYDDASNHLPAIKAALDEWVDLISGWGAPLPSGDALRRVA